jgi:hypothetical protein
MTAKTVEGPHGTKFVIRSLDEWLNDDSPEAKAAERAYDARLKQAHLLKQVATIMEADPAPQAANRVKCRGERLSRILWKSSQWAVTVYGIEARDGCYVIAKGRLWEEEDRHGWVRHMAGKDWVNLPEFAEALRIARRLHAPKTTAEDEVRN